MYKLPVFETLRAGYGFVWRQRSDLVAYAFLPVLLTSIISVFMATTGVGQIEFFNWLVGFNAEGPSQFLIYPLLTNGGLLAITVGTIATLIQVGIFIVFSVAWYRRYLIGQRSNPSIAVFQWQRRHLRYSTYLVVTIALIVVLFAIFVFTFFIFGVFFDVFFLGDENEFISETSNFTPLDAIAFIIASVLTVRFWLTLPASAVDDTQLTLRASRRITKRNSWRMWFVIWLGTQIPFELISVGYVELMYEGALVPVLQNSVVLLFLTVLILQSIEFAMIAARAACLAETYRRFMDNAAGAGAPLDPGIV